MEVIVDGTPETCLTQAASYFKRDWPYGGKFFMGSNKILLRAEKRTLFHSWSGIAIFVALSLVTAFAFTVVYFIYLMARELLDSTDLIQIDQTAEIFATPEGATRSRLTVAASRRDWQQTLESWVQKELVENKAAAAKPLPQQPAQTQPAASDIPEQIKKLAELRKAGAITEEEFEQKKAELLDRM